MSEPHGDNAKYDRIVDCKGVLKRVQVKSTWVARRDYEAFTFSLVHGSDQKQNYKECQADIIAAYVAPLGAWYLFPIVALNNQKRITINPKTKAYEIYRENWGVLVK